MCGILHIHPVEYILPDDQESALKSMNIFQAFVYY